ncbi:MAG: NAD(+) synthase, partial [Thermoleophilaceae bacterium]|nr:NAD(+) synthase [Thermoleophilaceae bacterium]
MLVMSSYPDPLTVALAQMNATVGDLEGNSRKIAALCERARAAGAALVVFPELALTGYPPEDLLLKTGFLDAAGEALEELAGKTQGIVALVGFPERSDDVYNAAAVLSGGEVQAVYRKMFLPNYGVFDEQRYFQSGSEPALIEVDGILVGLTICEDIWEPGPPATSEALAGAQVIVNLSASPYHAGKGREREQMLVQRARDSLVCIAFCNLVGGQDELVFDGHSVAIDQDGRVLARAPQFEESLTLCTFDPTAVAAERLQDARHRSGVRRLRQGGGSDVATLARLPVESPRVNGHGPDDGAPAVGGSLSEPMGDAQEVYSALTLGLRDYVEKNGFERVVFGLSGGIDSALVAMLAVDALGSDRVTCVMMPSPYSSQGTRDDARAIALNLGAAELELGIEPAMEAFDATLRDAFEGHEPDIAEENLQ